MKIIFHKMSKKYPNTIYGFKDSISYGYRKFELDIRGCKDRLILFHDCIYNSQYLENISLSDLNDIDTFDDFITEANKYTGLEIYLDIKGNNMDDTNKIISKLQYFSNNNKLFIQSFNIDIIRKIKHYNAFINCGLIVSGYHDISDKNLSIIDYLVIEEEYIDKYLDINIDKYLYTVNIDYKKNKYDKLGVKGIFTDYPLKFLHFNYNNY